MCLEYSERGGIYRGVGVHARGFASLRDGVGGAYRRDRVELGGLIHVERRRDELGAARVSSAEGRLDLRADDRHAVDGLSHRDVIEVSVGGELLFHVDQFDVFTGEGDDRDAEGGLYSFEEFAGVARVVRDEGFGEDRTFAVELRAAFVAEVVRDEQAAFICGISRVEFPAGELSFSGRFALVELGISLASSRECGERERDHGRFDPVHVSPHGLHSASCHTVVYTHGGAHRAA